MKVNGNDSAGNIDFNEINVIKDTTPPIITINTPIEESIKGDSPPYFNITIFDFSLNKSWYSLDNGVTNYTFEGSTGFFNQIAWEALPDGLVYIIFYANDTFGRIGTTQIIISKNTSISENPPINDLGNNLAGVIIIAGTTTGIIVGIAAFIMKKKRGKLR